MMAQNLLNFVLYTVLHTTAVTAQYIISKSLSLVTLVNCVGVTATEPRHNAMRRWRRSCLIAGPQDGAGQRCDAAIDVSRLSVKRPFVCPTLPPSVGVRYSDHRVRCSSIAIYCYYSGNSTNWQWSHSTATIIKDSRMIRQVRRSVQCAPIVWLSSCAATISLSLGP